MDWERIGTFTEAFFTAFAAGLTGAMGGTGDVAAGTLTIHWPAGPSLLLVVVLSIVAGFRRLNSLNKQPPLPPPPKETP